MEDDVNVMDFRRYRAPVDSTVALYKGKLRMMNRDRPTQLGR